MRQYSWDDITISQYQQITAISDMKCDEIDKVIKLLSIIEGNTEDHYLDMEYLDFIECSKRLEFMSTEFKPRIPNGGTYTIDGITYEMVSNPGKLTTGQFIDYENTISSQPVDIAMLCAIFCLPKGKKYGDGYDPLELRDKFNNSFKMVDAAGIAFFLEKRLQVSLKTILRSLCKKMKKEEKNLTPEKKERLNQSIKAVESLLTGNAL